jgi:hypothetical protein
MESNSTSLIGWQKLLWLLCKNICFSAELDFLTFFDILIREHEVSS